MRIPTEQEIADALKLCCDKHEIRGKQLDLLFAWAHETIVRYALLVNVVNEMIDVIGVKEDGSDVLFQITEKGKKEVEENILNRKVRSPKKTGK